MKRTSNDAFDSTREGFSVEDNDSCSNTAHATDALGRIKIDDSICGGNEQHDYSDDLGQRLSLSPTSRMRLKYITTNNSVTLTVTSKSTNAAQVPQHSEPTESRSTSSDDDDEPRLNITIEPFDDSNSSAALEQLRALREVTVTQIQSINKPVDAVGSDDESSDGGFDVEVTRAVLRSIIDVSEHPRVLRAIIEFSESSAFNKEKMMVDMYFLSGIEVSKDDLPSKKMYMYQVPRDQVSLAMQTENDVHCSLLVLPYQLGPGPETKEINKKRIKTNMDIFASFVIMEFSHGEMEFCSETNDDRKKYFFPPCNYIDRKIAEAIPDLADHLYGIPYGYFVIKRRQIEIVEEDSDDDEEDDEDDDEEDDDSLRSAYLNCEE